MSRYFYRQFFVKTPPLKNREGSLRGKTAIITGSNTGLGLETAGQLMDLGLSKLIIAVRSVEKGESARAKLLERRKQPSEPYDIVIWKLDLSSYQSVIDMAERAKNLERLDIVVLNAALFRITQRFNPETKVDEDVHVNYLANALLMVHILPTLAASAKANQQPGRLVLVSSDAAGWAKFTERSHRPILDAFKLKDENWNMQERYGTSKLLGQLFLAEIARRVSPSVVTIDAVNPGFCYGSELSRDGDGSFLGFLFRIFTRIVGKPLWMGARSVVHATAGFGQEVHGQYVEDGLIRP